MFFTDILLIDLFCPTNKPIKTKIIPTTELNTICSERNMNPQIKAKTGIKYATYDKKTGPDCLTI